MDKRILIISICAVILFTCIAYTYTAPKIAKTDEQINTKLQNPAQNNINEKDEQTKIIKDMNVEITQKEPGGVQKRGTTIQVPYTITNKGKNTVYDILVILKNGYEHHNLGNLKPGESKKSTYRLYIPTDSDMEVDMPGSGPLPNPWKIGCFSITFKDSNGVVHKSISNSIKIKWYN